MNTYEVTIRLKSSITKVEIRAMDANQAREMAEAQYGKGNVLGLNTKPGNRTK